MLLFHCQHYRQCQILFTNCPTAFFAASSACRSICSPLRHPVIYIHPPPEPGYVLALLPESGKGGGQTCRKAGDASCKGSGMPGGRGIRLNRQNGPVYYLDPSGVDDPENFSRGGVQDGVGKERGSLRVSVGDRNREGFRVPQAGCGDHRPQVLCGAVRSQLLCRQIQNPVALQENQAGLGQLVRAAEAVPGSADSLPGMET